MAHLRDKMSSAPEGTACPSHATDPSQTVPSILWERKCVVCPSQAEDCHTARLAPPAPVVRKQVLDPRTAWLEERSRGGLPPFCRGAARRLERTNGGEYCLGVSHALRDASGVTLSVSDNQGYPVI